MERSMTVEDRMMRLELDVGELKLDVGELKSDLKTLNARVNEWIIKSATEFGSLRTELEKSRADTEKGFGALKASIESAKLWMLVTGVGSVILVTFVTFLGRALKLF
jgi:hypothetical protein